MKLFHILACTAVIAALNACATATSPAMQKLYAVETDPINHWPAQNQKDLTVLQNNFVAHYQANYANNDVGSDYADLVICDLSQERALDIAGISPDMINPASPANGNVKNESTVTYEPMTIRSTTAGCAALANVEMHVEPNMVVNLKRLPYDFSYPVYMSGSYTKHTRNKVNINNKWRTSDLGIARVSVKRYRSRSEISGFPYQQTSWEHSQTLKQGDVDISRFKEQPMFIITYFSADNDDYKNITLFRQTMTNKTGNSITMRWINGDDFMTRTWMRNGTILTQKNGKQSGLFVVPMGDQPSHVYCKDEGVSVQYFRMDGDYDCVAANESEFGQDGVYMDPILRIRKSLPQTTTPTPAIAMQASTPANSTNPATAQSDTNTVSDTASECGKAYAARKACEKLPGDPFGLSLKLCLSQVKKNFGGLNCPLSF